MKEGMVIVILITCSVADAMVIACMMLRELMTLFMSEVDIWEEF